MMKSPAGGVDTLARQSLSGPDKSHRGYAIVSPGYGSLTRDIDAAFVVAHEGCSRSPARTRKRLERHDRYGLSRGKTAELDGNRRIDQRDRLIDDDHRGCQCTVHERTACRCGKSGGPGCEGSSAKSNSLPPGIDHLMPASNIYKSNSASLLSPAPTAALGHYRPIQPVSSAG